MLARKLDECQRTEAVFILFQLATSAMEEMIDNAVDGGARGSAGASCEMELLQESQRLELKLRDAEENALEMSARCEEAEALRQEAENAVLKMSARCEEAEKMRSECEHVLELGAEKDERIDLLREEIARMQEERMADDAENLAGNLRKEISDLQAKYQQACESASELQSRLESIQGVHESVGCQNEGDIQRGFERLQELEKSAQSIQGCFAAFECKSVEELRTAMLLLKLNVTCRQLSSKRSRDQAWRKARARERLVRACGHRGPWSRVQTLKVALRGRPPRRLVRRLGEALMEWQKGSRKILLAQS
jgi:dsDNA-specific endonuclease/ATPase MutS2